MPRKGQVLSPEAIAKMKLSKINRMLAKYNWDIATDYLDVKIDNGKRNRQKEFITLADFRAMLENGETFSSMREKGISKHLLQFFSNLLQNKINLPKDKFIEEYNSGMSLDDISDRYNVTREDMIFLRQMYECGAKGAKFQHRKLTEVPLTQRQKEIVYGSLMGDAKKCSPSSVGFGHCIEQKDYVLWLFEEMKTVASINSLKEITQFDERYQTSRVSCRFYTHANTDLENIIAEFYKDGIKKVSSEILSKLTPLSIAVWYMDDGVTDFNYRNISKYETDCSPTYMFCTQSFSKEECEMICSWFFDVYGISAGLTEKMSKGGIKYMVTIDKKSNASFVDLISSFILPVFRYKIDYNDYMKHRGVESYFLLIPELRKCPLGSEFLNSDISLQDKYVNGFAKYYHGKSFDKILPKPSRHRKEVNQVMSYDSDKLLKNEGIAFSNVGNGFLTAFFPHFWSAKAKANLSPKEVFNNAGYLSEIIRELILENKFPTSKRILRKLKRYRGNKSVSGFMPVVAKAIYDKYCKEDSRVIDFCAGYGGRLFGAFASKKVKSYTGIEINFDSYASLQKLYHSLTVLTNENKEVNLYSQDSILGMKMFADQSFDFCFTSPPYFDAEEYSKDESQSSSKFPRYSEWFEGFFIQSFKEACRVSKVVAINIENTGSYKIADDFEKYLVENNFSFIKDFIKFPKYGGGIKQGPVFVVESVI